MDNRSVDQSPGRTECQVIYVTQVHWVWLIFIAREPLYDASMALMILMISLSLSLSPFRSNCPLAFYCLSICGSQADLKWMPLSSLIHESWLYCLSLFDGIFAHAVSSVTGSSISSWGTHTHWERETNSLTLTHRTRNWSRSQVTPSSQSLADTSRKQNRRRMADSVWYLHPASHLVKWLRQQPNHLHFTVKTPQLPCWSRDQSPVTWTRTEIKRCKLHSLSSLLSILYHPSRRCPLPLKVHQGYPRSRLSNTWSQLLSLSPTHLTCHLLPN